MGEHPPFVGGRAVRAISRSAGKLDIYATAADGRVYGAAWQPDLPGDEGMPEGWRGWWHLVEGTAPAGAAVTVASRGADKVDIFVVSDNGVVYTAAWEQANPTWRPWRPLEGIRVPAGAPVECVSRSNDHLDIFVIDTEARIQTAAWQPSFGDTWPAWRQVAGGSGVPGAAVTAVSRSTDSLDIFVTGANGAILASAWNPAFGDTWVDWHAVASGTGVPGARVAAVSRSTDHLDLFITGLDGAVRTSAWEPAFGDTWSDWRQVAGGTALAGAPVGAVSRSTDKIDVFVADGAGKVLTSAWEPKFGADWAAWRQLGTVQTAPGGEVHAVSRAADHLDVFVAGIDGHVHTAAWQPKLGANWHAWSPIG